MKVGNILKESIGSFEYEVPDDKEEQLNDFYMTGLLAAEKAFANNGGTLYYNYEGGRRKEEDLWYVIDETRQKLYDSLGKNLLDAVMFSICAELRHTLDSNQTGIASKLDYPVITIGFMKEYSKRIAKYLRKDYLETTYAEPEGLSAFYNKQRRKREEDPETAYSDEELKTKFKRDDIIRKASYRCAMAAAKNNKEIIAISAADLFKNAYWNSSFGGSKWERIAKGWTNLNEAMEYGTLNEKMIWIDHVYDLQHNNGSVLTKVESYSKSGGYSWLKKVLDFKKNVRNPYELYNKCSESMRRLAAYTIHATQGTSYLRYMNKEKVDMAVDEPIKQKAEEMVREKRVDPSVKISSSVLNTEIPKWKKEILDKTAIYAGAAPLSDIISLINRFLQECNYPEIKTITNEIRDKINSASIKSFLDGKSFINWLVSAMMYEATRTGDSATQFVQLLQRLNNLGLDVYNDKAITSRECLMSSAVFSDISQEEADDVKTVANDSAEIDCSTASLIIRFKSHYAQEEKKGQKYKLGSIPGIEHMLSAIYAHPKSKISVCDVILAYYMGTTKTVLDLCTAISMKTGSGLVDIGGIKSFVSKLPNSEGLPPYFKDKIDGLKKLVQELSDLTNKEARKSLFSKEQADAKAEKKKKDPPYIKLFKDTGFNKLESTVYEGTVYEAVWYIPPTNSSAGCLKALENIKILFETQELTVASSKIAFSFFGNIYTVAGFVIQIAAWSAIYSSSAYSTMSIKETCEAIAKYMCLDPFVFFKKCAVIGAKPESPLALCAYEIQKIVIALQSGASVRIYSAAKLINIFSEVLRVYCAYGPDASLSQHSNKDAIDRMILACRENMRAFAYGKKSSSKDVELVLYLFSRMLPKVSSDNVEWITKIFNEHFHSDAITLIRVYGKIKEQGTLMKAGIIKNDLVSVFFYLYKELLPPSINTVESAEGVMISWLNSISQSEEKESVSGDTNQKTEANKDAEKTELQK